jgi:esterase/lipase
MEKKVEFKSGKEILRGSLFVPAGEGPFPGVIFFHGSESNRKSSLPVAQELSDKGYLCLAFDFSGHGESDGRFEDLTYRKILLDGQAALDFINKQNADKNRIGIKGSSMGAYVAGSMLLNNNIKSVIFSVPAAFGEIDLKIVDLIKRGKEYLNDKTYWEKSISLEGVRKFKGTVLVIRNELDGLLSKEMVESYYNEATNSKRKELFILKGARHSTYDNPEARKVQHKLAVDWFLETL